MSKTEKALEAILTIDIIYKFFNTNRGHINH